MAATYTCTRCNGSGHYSYNPRYGTLCFGCNGAGVTNRAPRGRRPYTPRPVDPNSPITIEAICGGDPTLYHRLANPDAALASCGITRDQLNTLADLYRRGVRTVPRSFLSN